MTLPLTYTLWAMMGLMPRYLPIYLGMAGLEISQDLTVVFSTSSLVNRTLLSSEGQELRVMLVPLAGSSPNLMLLALTLIVVMRVGAAGLATFHFFKVTRPCVIYTLALHDAL